MLPPPGTVGLGRLAAGAAKELTGLCKRTSQHAAAMSAEGGKPMVGNGNQTQNI